MPQSRLSQVAPVEKGMDYVFADADPNVLAREVDEFFAAQGYRLEEGVLGRGCYGKGSAVLRALLGVFAQRSKFYVQVVPEPRRVVLRVQKAMTGWWGGVFAVQAMKRETDWLLSALQQHFYQTPSLEPPK